MKSSNKKLMKAIITILASAMLVIAMLSMTSCKDNGGSGDGNQNDEGKVTYHTLNGKEIKPEVAYNLKNIEGATVFADFKPTCTEYGKGYYTCDCCDEIQFILINTVPHTYQTKLDTPPSCTEEGKNLKTCISCGHKEYETIEALGHKFIYEVTDCGDGMFAISGSCKCGSNKTNLAANAKEITKNPTCTEEGIAVYTLTDGSKIEISIPKLPHKLGDVDMDPNKAYDVTIDGITEFADAPASCKDESGKGYYNCSVCKEIQLINVIRDHKYSETSLDVTTEPTCTEEGLGKIYCSVCGAGKEQTVPAKGHSYEYKYNEAKKQLSGTCHCGDNLEMAVTSVEITKAATCTEFGTTVYHNASDGTSVSVDIPKTFHKLNGIFINPELAYSINIGEIKEFADQKATCESNGMGYYFCDACEKMQIITTKALEHDYKDATWTETEGGKTYDCEGFICDRCKDKVETSRKEKN